MKFSPIFLCAALLVAFLIAPTRSLAQAGGGPVQVWVEDDRLVGSRRIMFRPGHIEPTPSSMAVIAAMASTLKRTEGFIVVEGHADRDGDEAENIRLSAARAAVVAKALIRRGIPEARLSSVGRGTAVPLVGPKHPEQYRNRRIEVLLQSTAPAPAPVLLSTPDAAAVNPANAITAPTTAVVALPLVPDVPADVPTPTESHVTDVQISIALLDDIDEGTISVFIPLLGDDPPVLLALGPKIPLLLDEDDGLMPIGGLGLLGRASMLNAEPSIPLLDELDAPDVRLVD